jgi:hypothetical protein
MNRFFSCFLLSVVAAFFVFSGCSRVDHFPIYSQKEIAELDSLINMVEATFAAYAKRLSGPVDSLENENLRQQLMNPFLSVAININNKDKNFRRFTMKMRNEGVSTTRSQNINYFNYDILPDSAKAAASFSPISRTLCVNKNFKFGDLVDFLMTFHEVFHACQDVAERSDIETDDDLRRYMEIHTCRKGDRPKAFVDYEVAAYAYELELFNLIVDGRLRSVAHKGLNVDGNEFASSLPEYRDRAEVLNVLFYLASVYFIHDYDERGIRASFINKIAEMYKNAGHDLVFFRKFDR